MISAVPLEILPQDFQILFSRHTAFPSVIGGNESGTQREAEMKDSPRGTELLFPKIPE